ncbi:MULTISPECIES: ABC transporter permease [Streptosporangium]|uniref:Peptide/nickel transport system permease protein n=1 Tax=Streptosporangium brasiliense TaxID=47480 RepID=A0ABT9RD69_9ACTN|nr:ABC transporter permease [Streptosporangium brasiliense]MDP9867193.1 peptide/nickel transport system permease protein [Streptosporangium brasiliense]
MTVLSVHRRKILAPLTRLAGGDKLVTAALAVLAVLIVAAVSAPLIAPHDPDGIDLSATLSGSGADHLLGTDQSGRDILSRLIYGARTGLLGPLAVVSVSTVLGMLVGVAAAWHGGAVDSLLSRAMEFVFSFPALLLAIMLVAMFGAGPTAPIVAMSVAYTPYVGRLVRAVALQEKARPYIQAYRVQGWSGWVICLRHLIPNIAPLVLAQSAINFGYALMDLAALSFLGFGVQPPTADWGVMINDGSAALLQGAALPALAPGFTIVIAVVAFGVVGEAVADRVAGRER